MKKIVAIILIILLSFECIACGSPVEQKPKDSATDTTYEASTTIATEESKHKPATVSELAAELSDLLSEEQDGGEILIDNTEDSIILNGVVDLDSFVEDMIRYPDVFAEDWNSLLGSINLYVTINNYVGILGFHNINIIQNVVGKNTGTIYATYTNGDITYNILDEIPKTEWHVAGMYKVGVDIPAGEYFIQKEGTLSAYMAVYSDSTGDSILENENFNTFHFITVEDGQYFEVSRGKFTSVDNISLTYDPQNLTEGMYRVGIDIPAGEYRLECTSSSSGYVCVYPTSRSDRRIKTNDNFENNKYITVSDGEYLLLSRCTGALVE